MSITITPAGQPGAPVSAGILGHNIEMCLTTADGLLADRLRNPKFTGPPHRMSGVAPEWQGASCGRGFYELTPGAGLLGAEAQLIRMPPDGWNPALHQNRVPVRAGETLELELWARAWHQPVTLRIELRPLHSRSAPYDAGELTVDTSWYKRYTLPLKAARDDAEARLVLHVPGGGELWIDQIHLRPKGDSLLCRELVDEMVRMRIPTLRFPGGIVCNAYNWRHGTGPAHLRPAMLEAAFHQDWHLNYDFGLDEYLTVCVAQGIVPTFTLNVATGTPDEAREWAAYCAAWYERPVHRRHDPPVRGPGAGLRRGALLQPRQLHGHPQPPRGIGGGDGRRGGLQPLPAGPAGPLPAVGSRWGGRGDAPRCAGARAGWAGQPLSRQPGPRPD